VIEKLQVEIAERKKAQEELVVEKELSNEILNNIPAMVVLIDKNYGYMRWNKQLELATGLTAKQLLKAHAVEDFFKDEKSKNAAYKLLHEAFEKGIAQGDVTPLFPNMEATFHVIIRRITYEGQTCLLVLGSDISERKKAEEQLNESYLQIRSLTEHLQNIREEEQTRIAREIHDVLGQQLTVMKINVNLLNGKVANSNEQVKVKLQELSGLIDETIQTVRKISSELRPKLLDDLGLVAAMDWHLKEFEKQSGIRTYFNEPEEEWELSEKTKTGLFRIFQEALTNVARHAQATQVQVALTKNNGQLRLSITDNGKGFSLQEAAQKKTLGMLGMKERTAIIGGDYQIHSEPGKGTSVIILLPIQNKS
jgi:PAS domain S-box-containing protein